MKAHGAGLGLRRELFNQLNDNIPDDIDFWEVAPENWIKAPPSYLPQFKELIQSKPLVTHGLSLSIGGIQPLDVDFVKQIKHFLKQYNVTLYSEHLSYCTGHGHLYDLMPIPFTEEAVKHVSQRIKQVQDILERQLVLENVSYYAAPGQKLSEIDFINAILHESGCQLLLDVNNVYVNSINHNYNPKLFIQSLPSDKVVYGHIAGHFNEADDLLVDTHGADVIDPVWDLLDFAYQQHGVFPTLLERDFNLPSLADLVLEVKKIKQIQSDNNGIEAEHRDRA
ncbi:DUF692 domain-containing protein [Neptunicella marina]|uniref:DUF692 domain-containing protein n=1 Tax=Neptunicella marina TaxID=2125989 RepID=A0A8J6IWD8_9ALTE|nr:DUF692 domain-containing protein [Neptunicella marina]MBC3767776.1 DUF692 domain-containing protein [Neptunicella marina]